MTNSYVITKLEGLSSP